MDHKTALVIFLITHALPWDANILNSMGINNIIAYSGNPLRDVCMKINIHRTLINYEYTCFMRFVVVIEQEKLNAISQHLVSLYAFLYEKLNKKN